MGKAEQEQFDAISLAESNRALGTDELHLSEFPLAVCGHRPTAGHTSLVFTDEIYDEGNRQTVQRRLTISASEAYGNLTPADSDVLIVLMHLTNCRTRFQSATVHFTRYELVKFLGWDDSGKSYRRLELSLQRLASVTLFYNRAWWDRDRRRWLSQTFHILEALALRGRESNSGANDDGYSSFTWNKVLFSSFQANYLKRLDLGTYFRLRLPVAKQAYRFLDKRFYRAQRFEMDLRTFACEKVGLARSYDNAQLKRKLIPALLELETIGFLVPQPPDQRFVRLRHGVWRIVLQRQRPTTAMTSGVEQKPPLVVALTERGIRPTIAAGLVHRFPAERITEKIELHDWLLARQDKRIAQNPSGFLAAAIREDYQLPKGFLTRAAREHQSRAHREQQRTAAVARTAGKHQTAVRQAALAHWENLSESDRVTLEALAVAEGNAELVEKYQQLGNSPFAALLLKELVVNYLKRTDILSSTAPSAVAPTKS